MNVLNLFNRLFWKIYNLYMRHKFKCMKGYIYHPHQLLGTKFISIGNHTLIGNGIILTAWDSYSGDTFTPVINIGDYCMIGEHTHISAINSITIGNGVLIGRYVYISDNSHGKGDFSEAKTMPIKRPLYSKGAVRIGDNVWIGERACILPGVTIGEGSIIGANAVVTHSVPPFCVAGGVPAKIIKRIKS